MRRQSNALLMAACQPVRSWRKFSSSADRLRMRRMSCGNDRPGPYGDRNPHGELVEPRGPAASVLAALEQAAGDDLGLNFGSAFENVQDARIAENAAHRIFEREPVAAMDLHGIVGSRPGNACGQ